MTRCAEQIISLPPKKGKKENVGMAWPHPLEVWSSGFSHGEKDAQKGGDLMYILYVWVAQLMRPMKKENR